MTNAFQNFSEAYNELMLRPNMASALPALAERLGGSAIELQQECEAILQENAEKDRIIADMQMEVEALETENARLAERNRILEAGEKDANEICALAFKGALGDSSGSMVQGTPFDETLVNN